VRLNLTSVLDAQTIETARVRINNRGDVGIAMRVTEAAICIATAFSTKNNRHFNLPSGWKHWLSRCA
jgi:hypothetical protein